MSMKKTSFIEIQGAEENNLKNINVNIPLNAFTVICGPSGSGKSSLAFETLFAEGQRRYTETLSNYVRQYIKEASKPQVKSVSNIPPPVLLKQRNTIRSSRSTVGSHSEVLDPLRVILSKIGLIKCPKHNEFLKKYSSSKGALEIKKRFSKGYLLFPIEPFKKKKQFLKRQLIQDGFSRIAKIKNKKLDILRLSEVKNLPSSLFYVAADRLNFSDEKRVSDSLSLCYRSSLQYNPGFSAGKALVFDIKGEMFFLSEKPSCPVCCFEFSLPLIPSLFNPNSPLGACESCKGFGNHLSLDQNKIIPHPQKTLAEGALKIFSTPSTAFERRKLHLFCNEKDINLHTPWQKLSKKSKSAVWKGDKNFIGVQGFFDFLEKRKYKMHVRILLSRYKSTTLCSECKGQKLREETNRVLFQNKNISEWSQMNIEQIQSYLDDLKLSSFEKSLIKEPLKNLKRKINFIQNMGLGYLQLNRPLQTLSGGEFQRLNLAGQLGMGLSQVLYILDEPTIGLHASDCQKLLSMIQKLQTFGNTIVVVEHDADVIKKAAHIIEMGPGSGFKGGKIVYSGSKTSFFKKKNSLTVQALLEKKKTPKDLRPVTLDTYKYLLKLKNCQLNNLKNINVSIPLNRLSVCTGVSGSGKSSLVVSTLYKSLQKALNKAPSLEGCFLDKIEGYEKIARTILIDQAPADQNSRSFIATYMSFYSNIRSLISETPSAMRKKLSARDFSLNVDGGRCPECRGLGYQEIEMVFMDPIKLICESCKGLKFQSSLLEVKFKNKNIHEILQMTVRQAMEFFTAYPVIFKPLSILNKVGLEYLTLGQNLSTLSGGESQRMKLAREFSSSSKIKETFYILDEPSTGLHFREVDLLLKALNHLVDEGATVLLVEHNLQIISKCDYIIDLGPQAGENGGYLTGQGALLEFIKENKGVTSQCLRKFLNL